jgi:AraC-like DNA-binding protein
VELAAMLQVLTSTLMSRFFRCQLPPPRRYLAYARLVFAARLFENPGLSVASVAMQLDYSSSQSFSRHVRTTLGMSATDFRRRYDSRGMLQRLRDDLVLRYRAVWIGFDPLLMRRVGRPPAADAEEPELIPE